MCQVAHQSNSGAALPALRPRKLRAPTAVRYEAIEEPLVFLQWLEQAQARFKLKLGFKVLPKSPKSNFLSFRFQIRTIAVYNRCCLSCRFALTFNLDSLPSYSLHDISDSPKIGGMAVITHLKTICPKINFDSSITMLLASCFGASASVLLLH